MRLFLAVLQWIGTLIIFRSTPDDFFGMSIALLATVLGVFYTLINIKLTKEYSATILNFYEMTIGVVFISIYMFYFGEFNKFILNSQLTAFLWILILSSVCTAYAITKSISLMKVMKSIFYYVNP